MWRRWPLCAEMRAPEGRCHAQDVRVAAMEALRSIARKKPDAIAVTAVELLAYFMHSFTVASGVNLATFQCLVELNTAESLEVVKATIESGRGGNDQFARRVNILREAKGLEILRKVDLAKLSRTRRNMISRVLARESGNHPGASRRTTRLDKFARFVASSVNRLGRSYEGKQSRARTIGH